MTINIAGWRYQSRKILAEVSETAEIELNAVLCKVLKKNLPWCLANSNFLLSQDEIQSLNNHLKSLMNGVPLAYVLGEIEFFGYHFAVDPNVLIPRPETELIVETAIKWLHLHEKAEKMVDVGCGSGAIMISILKNFPEKKGYGIDISKAALNISLKNREFHHIKHLDFVQMDCLQGIQTKFDLIVANLPYIPEGMLDDLQVSTFEPEIALNGGKDGLAVINKLIKQLPILLNKPGMALLEIQFDQSAQVVQKIENLMPEAVISVIKDYSNHEQIIKLEV